MSKALDKASEQFRAGQFKKAADTLWEVTFGGDDGDAEAQALLALATQLRDASEGGVRADCGEHIARARRYLEPKEDDQAHREAALRRDPVALARLAHEIGLTWLTVDSEVDLTAAPLTAALGDAASPPPPCVLDAVEAEGWRLECVTRAFQPVSSLPWGASDRIGEGYFTVEERFQYLFRREHEISG